MKTTTHAGTSGLLGFKTLCGKTLKRAPRSGRVTCAQCLKVTAIVPRSPGLRRERMDKPKTEYTPGPWEVGRVGSFGLEVQGGGQSGCFPVARLGIRSGFPWNSAAGKYDESHDASAEMLANARLIAAAPELYSALRSVVKEMRREHDAGDGHFSTQEVEDAERAIAKAEGR